MGQREPGGVPAWCRSCARTAHCRRLSCASGPVGHLASANRTRCRRRPSTLGSRCCRPSSHLLAVLVRTMPCSAMVSKGRSPSRRRARTSSSGHPEERMSYARDSPTSDRTSQIGRPVRPAEGGEGPQTRGEPGVEDSSSWVFPRAAARRGRGRQPRRRARTRPDPVAPPQLPRNAPVVHVGRPSRTTAARAPWGARRHRRCDRIARGLRERTDP